MHYIILIQELCFNFLKELAFRPIRCYGLSVVEYGTFL